MHIELPPDFAERLGKLRQIIENMGLSISTQELVERITEDGLEVACYRLGLALRDPLPEEPNEAA